MSDSSSYAQWRNVSLAEVLQRVSGGGTPSRSDSRFWNGSIPWASVKDFRDDILELEDTEEHISEAGLLYSASQLIDPGVPVVCTRMAVGRAALTTRPTAINQDLKALYPGEDVEPRFLIRLLALLRPKLEAVAIGSTVKGIRLDQLLKETVDLPSVPEQRRIAEVLDTADEAIRQTEALIAKLKQMKQGLLHDLLTRGLDEHGELRDPIARPEQFNNSLVGTIPLAWEVRPLAEIATVERGKFTARPRNDPRYYGGAYPFIQTGDVTRADGDIVASATQTLNDLGLRVSKLFPRGTIAVTIAANIADTAILGNPMCFPDSVVGVQVHAPHSVRYVELCIRRAKRSLEARAPQSAQKNINLTDLRPLRVPVPKASEQAAIVHVYEAYVARLSAEVAYLDKLRLLKKGLMQDLLTGRVRVPVAKHEPEPIEVGT